MQSGALGLFSERLPNVSAKVREDGVATIVKIIKSIQSIASREPMTSYQALQSIGLTVLPGEEPALTSTIPLLVAGIRARRNVASAMAVLLSYSYA